MNVFKKNLSWILVGNIAHAVLQFGLNIYCARILGSFSFGILNYCASLIAFFTAIGTLGYYGVITKLFADDEKDAGKYLGSAIISRIAFSLIAILALQLIVLFDENSDQNLQLIVFCQSLQILFSSADLFIYWFRYKNNAKRVAILRLLAFFFSALWRFIAIYIKSLELYSLGVSCEFMLFSIFLFKSYKKVNKTSPIAFDYSTTLKLLKLSYPFIVSSFLMTIYGQTDKIMLKGMIDFESVGLYSVSLTLAGAISIIPSALIEGFRPDIMKYRNSNLQLYKRRFIQLYSLVFWGCITYGVVVTFFSRPLIQLLYGEQYLGAINSLSIIVWYTSFSYFGAINNMYMVAEGKSFWIQIITLIGAVLNVVLNFFFIPFCGIVGAAIASLITQIFGNYILMYLIKPLRGGFKLLNEGIIVKWVKQ